MAKLLKLRRGTTAQHSSFTGAEGECTVDMTKDTLVVHDGSTAGGHVLLREDMSNLPAGTIDNADVNASAAIAGTKISPSFGNQTISTSSNIDVEGYISIGSGNATHNISTFSAGNTAINSVLSGSNFGTLQTTAPNGHHVIELQDNDVNDSFAIVSGGGNFQTDSAIDTCVARFRADGNSDIHGILDVNGRLDANGGLAVTGNTTTTGNITIADDKKLKLGASDDLILFHQTSNNNSIIKENGGGALSIQTNGPSINFYDTANSTSMLIANAGGSVDLYHQNNVKLATASDGIDVTGSIDATTDIKTTGGAFRIDTNFFINEEASAGGSAESPDGSTIIKNGAVGKDLHLGAYGDIALGSSNSTANTVAKFQMPVLGASKHGVCYLNYVTANAGGSASSSNKLETKSTGVGITGTLDVGAINGTGNIYTAGNIGRDSTDMIHFTDNTQLDVWINNSNEFRFEADGDFHADGDIVAYSSTTASDSRLKSDIHTINDALGIVGKLRGVSYKWLRDGKADIGVIAQEVEEVIPEIVKTKSSLGLDGPEEIKTVDYGKLVGVLINAINELKAELDEHKKGGK